jgi:hypothetical protein
MKLCCLAFVVVVAMLVATGRRDAPAPIPRPRPAPKEPWDGMVECDPVPGLTAPGAGEIVSVVNDHESPFVVIKTRDDPMFRLPNPTRVRILVGRPMRRPEHVGIEGFPGLYPVEVVDGPHRGVRGLAHPNAMRR